MSLDPALTNFTTEIEGDARWPRPLCPVCQAGHLQFGEPDQTESPMSRSLRGHEAWEPEWINGTFMVAAECGNEQCRQTVRAVGAYRVDYASQMDDALQYSVYFRVTYFNPPLVLMRVPMAAPEEVRDGIERASAVIFADPGLAATAVRAAVERFLTTEGFPAHLPGGGFKSLDKRIRAWRRPDPTRAKVADLLLAVKWIGNAGAHEVAGLTAKDVLDGVEILNEAFHRLWVGPDIDARAQAINAAKGPHRPSRT